jgi:hypothetical protein
VRIWGSRHYFLLCRLSLCMGLLFSVGQLDAKAEKIHLTGLIDWYYQFSFNHPLPGTNLVPPRAFDIKNDSFSLSLVEVNLTQAATAKSPIGFTATFTLGKTADLVHFTEPGGTPNPGKLSNDTIYKYTQQLFGTYVTPGSQPFTMDFGKFVTLMGFELIESSTNDNYSRGLLFTYAIPFYHTGLRITRPLSSTLAAQLHLVNGWNNVEDDNSGKSIGVQFAWNPNSAWTWVVNWMGGDESTGAALPANLNVQLVDLLGIWRPTDRLKLGINVDYASAFKAGAAGGHWSGQAVYLRYQLNKRSALAVRLEHFEDTNGLRTGTAQNLNSATATFEYVVHDNLLHRLEFRHDKAGKTLFPSGGGGSTSMQTITFSQVVRF